MIEHSFIIYFDGRELDDFRLDRFFEAGCEDATFGSRNGKLFADFDRAAVSLGEAIATAIRDLTSADPDLRITGFEPAAPVSQSAIADHVGMSREGVRLIAAGDRGPGDFPQPITFSGRVPLYSWGESHRWLEAHGYECSRQSDFDSEIAIETIWGLLRFQHLRQSWTEKTQEEAQRVASALPESDFLKQVLALATDPARGGDGE